MDKKTTGAYHGIDSETPLDVKLCAKYKKSYAYVKVKDKLPVILTTVINDLSRTKGEIIKLYGRSAAEDVKSIIGQISKLKNELVTNKQLVEFHSKNEDVEAWNEYLNFLATEENALPCWYYLPWLYIECYMYRRLWEMFQNSEVLKEFDPFLKQKEDLFYLSIPNLVITGNITLHTLAKIESSKENVKEKFIEYIKLSLWSNRYDLSLKNGTQLSKEECCIGDKDYESFLLIDDSEKVYKLLEEKSSTVIDFVTANSPFEVFSDFCFADYLCTIPFVTNIRFHVKKIPWFVSDTTRKDVHWILNKLEEEGLEDLSERWRNYFQRGIWTLLDEKFWVMPYDYNQMKTKDTDLFDLLSTSNLVIFKGDLHYRKLLGDINWNQHENFEVAIRDFKPTNILSLRVVKSDLICGLPSENVEFRDKKWMRAGEYGTIQFYNHT